MVMMVMMEGGGSVTTSERSASILCVFVYTKLGLLEIMIHSIKLSVWGAACVCLCACIPASSKPGPLIYSQQTASSGGNREALCTCNSNVPVLAESKQVTLGDSPPLGFMWTRW